MRKTAAALFAALTGLCAASTAFAAPAQVVIIRHGEKPEIGNSLNLRGFDRAVALVNFFKVDSAVAQHGAPAAIYATGLSTPDGSLRPIQTVTPLASALGLPINVKHTKNQLSDLVEDVMHDPSCDGKTVLICWKHNAIPKMARAFGFDSAPSKWPSGVFDRAWILNFDGSKAASFEDVPERVLPGDSAE